MIAETFSIFAHPLFTNIILPFLLIFVVVYAILEKTSILGEEKKYANLLVAIIIGFMFIGVQSLVGFTIRLILLIATMVIILLGYFLVFGFIGIKQENKGTQVVLGILFGLAIIVSVIWAAGLLEKIQLANINSDVLAIIIFIMIFGGAIALVLTQSKDSKK